MTAVFKYGNVNLLIIRVCDCIWNKIMADKYLMGGHKLHWHLNKVIDCQGREAYCTRYYRHGG